MREGEALTRETAACGVKSEGTHSGYTRKLYRFKVYQNRD